jgi:glutamyl/glutaminyl-tRNA synthetase
MGITTVLRGEEWLPSTPKHLVLYEAFGWQPPRFAHTPLILNPDKSKLSKRQGDVSAVSFLERGYLPETILNFIATLGFNPKGDQELYSPQELQELFSLEQVKPSGAVLNMEKLDWMNRHYLREAPLDALARALGTTSMNDAERRALDVERSRATTLLAIADALPTYQQWQAPTLDALRWKEVSPEGTHRALHALEEWLSAHDDFSSVAALEHALREQIGKWDAPVGSILLPLRVALAGKTPSPSPFELLYVLGREESLRRLRACFSN